jgi:hypothetical protein
MIDYLNGCVYIDGYEKYESAFRKLNAIIDEYRVTPTKKAPTVVEEEEKPAVEVEKYPDAREWTTMIDVDDFKLNDICFVVVDGKKLYYKMIDEYHFDLQPNGEEGKYGWEPID